MRWKAPEEPHLKLLSCLHIHLHTYYTHTCICTQCRWTHILHTSCTHIKRHKHDRRIFLTKISAASLSWSNNNPPNLNFITFLFLWGLFFWCVCCVNVAGCTGRGQRTTLYSQFFPSMWVVGMKFKLSGSGQVAISLALNLENWGKGIL